MRRTEQSVQYTAVFIFIIFIILVLSSFLLATNGLLQKINEENARSRQFLSDWLSYKADRFAYLAAPELSYDARLAAELALCEEQFLRISDSPMIESMRRIQKLAVPATALVSKWAELRSVLASPKGIPDIERSLLSAAAFESAVQERIALIGSFERNQRRAIAILQQSLIIAILALVGLGIWSSIGAKRAEADRRHMQDLIGATFAAQEAERRRIALDLHDSIAQEIAAALMIARRLGEIADGSRASLVALLKSTIDALRRISWEMRPPELERLGFQGAVVRLLEDFKERNAIALEMAIPEREFPGLREGVALQLYRIIQEALANIEKHAEAKTLRISVSRSIEGLIVAIADDGSGFDASASERSGARPSHLGLAGMRERSRLIGASFELSSVPGKGTRIRVEVPCAD